MGIGLITSVYDYEKQRRGVANYVKRLVESLKKLHFDDLCLIHYEKSGDELYKGVNEIVCPLFPVEPRKVVTILLRMPKLLRKAGIDLIHLPAPIHFENAYFLLNGFKKVLTIHDLYLFFPWFRAKYPYPDPLKWIGGKLWKPTLVAIKDKVDMYIADSGNTKEDIIRLMRVPEEKIKVIYLAPDNIFKRLKGVKIPVYIGSPYILSNTIHKEIIRAYFKLRKMGIKHKFVFFGRIPKNDFKALKSFIEKLNLQHDVVFLDYVPENELVKLYNAASFFVRPSLYEGFGLPPLEAMACGCPVIASDIASLPEVVGDAGILVHPHDVNEWTNAMYEVLTNEGLRKELAREGLKRSKTFSWDKTAKETIKSYKELVGT